ncbi:protein kinase-like domain, concanavalin A-like lectin/glucanase domain protein, partial [Tanacetum coccineum]
MGDENPRCTLGDYSRPRHKGNRNTIESEDPNQHLKDFLKIVDSIDLNVETRERTRLRLFQFSIRDQTSNWLERLPAGSISTWEDLTTRFLAHFFPPGRTSKLRNDILMFQQHQEDLALYDNKSWNDPRDFAKPVKAISIPHDVPSAFDRRLVELENQVQLVPMILNIAWKIPSKLLLITRLREATKWEASRSLLIKGQEPSTKPTMLGKTNQTLVGNVPKLSRAHKGAQLKKERESRDTTPREHEGLTSEVDDEVGSNELEEEEEDDLEYFNTFPSMKELEYHEWRHYKQIMSQKLESRQKPSNLCKRRNFVGRVRGLKVFIGNFTYKCDFMILIDTTSIIDHDLGEIAFGNPFIEETGLDYDKEEGTIVFRKNDEKITFKMPHRMEMFGHIDLKDMNTDPIPPFVLGNKNEHGKVYYSNSLIIGPKYKQNESVSKEIQCLMNLERTARNKNGGVT